MSPNGLIWGIRPLALATYHKQAEYAVIQYTAKDTTPSNMMRKITFHASMRTAPIIFAVDEERVYYYTTLQNSNEIFLRKDGAKEVFIISRSGDLHSLFQTSKHNNANNFRDGDLFCIDRYQ